MSEEFLTKRDELGRLVDDIDVYRQYDQAMIDLINIPRPDFTGRKYTKEELDLWDVKDLRVLAKERDVVSEVDRKDVLIKAIINYQKIPVVFATGEPAYSTQELATGRKEGTPVKTIRYPIASLQRLAPVLDNDLFNLAPRRKIAWSADGNAVIQGQQPNPLIIQYQLDFLATKTNHMNFINIFMDRAWGKPHVRILVDIGAPWGERAAFVYQDGTYVDSTEYEMSADKAEKMLRHTYTMVLNGWMPLNHWVTPTVRKFTRSYTDIRNTDDVLLEITEKLDDIYKDSE